MIYILLLYQLYSLIHFSEKIEYELSADAKDYLKAPEAYNLKLKEIQAEINTFPGGIAGNPGGTAQAGEGKCGAAAKTTGRR